MTRIITIFSLISTIGFMANCGGGEDTTKSDNNATKSSDASKAQTSDSKSEKKEAKFKSDPIGASDIVLIKFHADHCGTCKNWDASEPGFAELSHKVAELGIDVFKFDFTDESRAKSAETLADSLGVRKIYDENEMATGFAMLIDRKAGKVLATISPKKLKTVDEQFKAIQGAIPSE